jgi:hypothetical protein
MLKSALFTTLAAAAISLPALTAPAIVSPAAAQASLNVSINTPPPAPIYEVVPPQRAGYVWNPGFWRWEGSRHVWVKGNWLAERRGYAWVPNRWERAGNGWRHEEGHWNRMSAWGDRDHDGVPNAYDRRPDNPYRH